MEEGSSDGEERAQANHLKKRARKNKSVSVVFDEDARKEFVTGFRKRKLQRRKVAEVQKEKKDRQKRLLERKERRQALQEARGGSATIVAEEEQDPEDEVQEGVTSVAGTVIYEYGEALITTVTTSAIVPEEEEAAIGGGGGEGSTDSESREKAIPRAQVAQAQVKKEGKVGLKRKRKQKAAVSHRRTPLKSSKRKRADKAKGKTRSNSKRRK